VNKRTKKAKEAYRKIGNFCDRQLKKGNVMPIMTLSAAAVKKRQTASLILNIFIVAMEIIGTSLTVKTQGISLFQFYTEDSNIFALFACAVCAAYTARNLKSGVSALPRWVKTMKYMATCCLSVTFVVVICILAPMAGVGGFRIMLLSGSMLYHHLICPVAALISFVFFETDPQLTRKYTYFALIPTGTYAAVAIILNIARVMKGPYPFLRVYEQPVYMSVLWFVVIFGGAYLLAWLILLANRKCSIGFIKKSKQRADSI
jgi:hypothetical protein